MNSEVKVVQPSGILNSSLAGQLCREVDEVVKSGIRLVLIDLQDVTFIDSSGLGGLVNAFKSARIAGSKLVFCSVCEQARMLFEITGMDQVFEIFLNQSEFTKALAETA
ncbi:MAG: STAS domain-containing protein [Leptolyngbyaceae cyanobacterium RU_5_1]|nr:STAS domain-containing protein [Leptolyngbyaceae cyanobacterium RU_5_1]